MAMGLGALGALGLFAAECALIFRANAVGLSMDTRGPFEALARVVLPRLPGLLVRVALAYAVAGAALGLAAGLLAAGWLRERRRVFFGAALADYLALWGLLAWERAIWRPALFDDLPAARRLLAWVVEHGRPWQPALATGVLVAAHAAAALVRLGPPAAAGSPLRPGREHRALRAVVLLGGAALGVLLLSTGAIWTGGARARPGRVVLLIGIDAFRPDRVEPGSGQRQVAPNLQAFLEDATRFTRAYTPIAQTEPAWRSLLTAAWPFRTGVRYPLTSAERRVPLATFPELFNDAGFDTTFATDCSRFNYQGPASGFRTLLEPPKGAVNFLLEKLRFRGLGLFADNALGALLVPEFVDNRALAGIYDPYGYAKRLSRALLKKASGGPTLFAFHDTAAHFPGDPAYPFYRKYVSRSEPLERRLRMFFSPLNPGARGGWNLEGAVGLYDELLSQGDAQLGILLAALKEAGLYDEALIAVFSDHGESFHDDFPRLAGATPVHGARLSEDENRILLAIKLPRSLQAPSVPHTVDGLVRLIDLGPTVLDAMGLPPLPGADGVSLMPLLRGAALPQLRLYAETGYTHATPDVFDPGHFSGGARGFDAYRVLPDGTVEMNEHAHELALREKDVGAFDGRGWLIQAPMKNGSTEERCQGECSAELRDWLNGLLGAPIGTLETPGRTPHAGRTSEKVRPERDLLRLRARQPQGAAHRQLPGG